MTRASRRPTARMAALSSLLVSLTAACGHSDAFTTPDSRSDGPFADATPIRLTYATTADLDPAWIPGGAALAYSYQRPESREGDWCVGFLPVGGGAIAREVCARGLLEADSVTTLEMVAIAPAGDLAYVRSSRPAFSGQGGERALVAATVENPLATQVLRTLPFTGTGGMYVAIGRPAWIGPGQLAFPGFVQAVVEPCPGCDPSLITYPRNLFRLATANPGVVEVIPGTDFATSVSAGESPDVIYYTIANDSRIHRRVLSTGATETAYDFGAEGIARDVHYSNGRIAAIVGGVVSVIPAVEGPLQSNGPGKLFIIDAGTGVSMPDPRDNFMYMSPALSESGEGLAAVRFDVAISPISGSIAVFSTGDIVRFGVD